MFLPWKPHSFGAVSLSVFDSGYASWFSALISLCETHGYELKIPNFREQSADVTQNNMLTCG